MDKREAFELLAPQEKDFMRSVADCFGKPAAVSIRFKDGRQFKAGIFKPAQSFSDYHERCPAPLYQRQRRLKRK